MTRERIRQIEARAIKDIHQFLNLPIHAGWNIDYKDQPENMSIELEKLQKELKQVQSERDYFKVKCADQNTVGLIMISLEEDLGRLKARMDLMHDREKVRNGA